MSLAATEHLRQVGPGECTDNACTAPTQADHEPWVDAVAWQLRGWEEPPATQASIRTLIDAHRHQCQQPDCPFLPDSRHVVVIARRFEAATGEDGGWEYRNAFCAIARVGEWVSHLLLPEVQLHAVHPRTPGMDGDSPLGSIEIKASAIAARGDIPRHAFTLRARQRADHALPALFVALDEVFLDTFRGRSILLPRDTTRILQTIRAIYAVPMQAFPRPRSTFAIPIAYSPLSHIRAIQTVFRYTPGSLMDLGIEGLARLRTYYDRPERAMLALRYLESLGTALRIDALHGYRLDPYRLLRDAEAALGRGASARAVSRIVPAISGTAGWIAPGRTITRAAPARWPCPGHRAEQLVLSLYGTCNSVVADARRRL